MDIEYKLLFAPFFVLLISAVLSIIIWCILCIIIGKIKQKKATSSNSSEYISIKQCFKLKYFLIIEFVFALIMLFIMLFNHYSYYPRANTDKYEFDNGSVTAIMTYKRKTFFPSETLTDSMWLTVDIGDKEQSITIYPDTPENISKTDITYIEENDGITVNVSFSENDIKTYKFYFNMFDTEENYEN